MPRLLSALAVCTLFGCATTAPLSVDENRAEAKQHEAAAEAAREHYDPGATRVVPQGKPGTGDEAIVGSYSSYNPTDRWLDEADRQLRAAAAHLKAARQLESFEDQACQGIPPEQRAACPLLASSVTTVDETRHGVRLHLKPTVDAPATARMLRCHLAFAQARGFDRPSCPLFVKTLAIDLVDGAVLDFHATDAAAAETVRRQARLLFQGSASGTPQASLSPSPPEAP